MSLLPPAYSSISPWTQELNSGDRVWTWAGGATRATLSSCPMTLRRRHRFLPEGAEYRQLAGHLTRPGQVGVRLKNGKMTVVAGTVGVAVGEDRTKIKVNGYA